MKKWILFASVILSFLTVQVDAQIQMQFKERVGDYPEVPRVSAYEAYIKYKAGKAIIMHAGGEAYNGRHILGAFNLEKYNDQLLLKFPKQGIEIFTYCY
ncbi:MAG: hypothetical protein ABSH06_22350 [Thermodesulfobacteriota bacterium]|jgi:hypothetical protein